MAETEGKEASAKSICRSGRCRNVAIMVLVVAGGLLAWWSADKGGEEPVPAVPERASAMLPGVPAPSQSAPAAPMASPDAGAQPLPGLDVMADKLAKRLEKEPADGEGWALLARTYLELGNVAKADAAYAKALELRPNDEIMKADYTAARKALKPTSP